MICRKEETRTPDPHVPNVVRYQLRYFPSGFENRCKGTKKSEKKKVKSEKLRSTARKTYFSPIFFREMLAWFGKKTYLCTRKTKRCHSSVGRAKD